MTLQVSGPLTLTEIFDEFNRTLPNDLLSLRGADPSLPTQGAIHMLEFYGLTGPQANSGGGSGSTPAAVRNYRPALPGKVGASYEAFATVAGVVETVARTISPVASEFVVGSQDTQTAVTVAGVVKISLMDLPATNVVIVATAIKPPDTPLRIGTVFTAVPTIDMVVGAQDTQTVVPVEGTVVGSVLF